MLYRWSNPISATECSFSDDYLYEGVRERSYRNVGGRSSDGTMPFFDLGANGKGVMPAIAAMKTDVVSAMKIFSGK
jgi:hypothetical protein